MFFIFVLGLAAPATIDAVGKARAGQRALENAADAVRVSDADLAERELTTALQELRGASNALDSWLTWPARTVPGTSRQYKAASAIVRSAELLANAGSGPLGVLRAQPGGFALRNGAFDLGALTRAGEALTAATPAAQEARRAIENAPSGWLLPPLESARAEAADEVTGAADAIVKGAAGLRAAPTLLGSDGPKRYIVLHSNLAELRGTGGILSYYTLIEADAGQLRLLPESGRTARDLPRPSEVGVKPPQWYMDTWGRYNPLNTWQNINMTTDFPTAADIFVQTASAKFGPIDGAIQIDPYGLSALLKLSGPVSVPGWPEPITSSNIPKIAQHDMYVRFEEIEPRDAFGENLISAVFGKFITSNLQPRLSSLQGLGDAVGQGHLKVYSTNDAVQQELARAEIDGGLHTDGATDVLGVFNQNAGANKLDWFLRRSIRYEVRPGPNDTAFGILTVTLRNEAPSSGLPQYILGPNTNGIAAGENRTILTVIRPRGSRLLAANTGGKSSLATIDQDKDLLAHQIRLSVPPGESETVEMIFILDPAVLNHYRLTLVTQPTVAVDDCRLLIERIPASRLPRACL
ncbi:MAG: DUF4012 domain-containing protein [Actinomycetota bacterium]